MRFSQRLKRLRKDLNLRQDDLAKACGVKLTAISKYENELIKPAFEMLSKIGMAYNVNLNWLINEIGGMFIETPSRRLIKTGSGDFITEETEDNTQQTVMSDEHNLQLESDLRVEYYGANNETMTKIYRKDGKIEYNAPEKHGTKNQKLYSKIEELSKDENKYEFVMTAINALSDEKALNELKILIKGMDLAKKK